MSIAIFASKTFQVSSRKIYTLDEFTVGSSLETETQDSANKKPSTYIKGPGLMAMSFNIAIKSMFGINVRKEYDEWNAVCEAGKAYPFILGGKPFGKNKWLLKGADLEEIIFDNKGNMISAALQLDFEEYIRAGSAKDSKNSKSPGISNEMYAQLETEIFNTYDNKRSNPNVAVAVSRGPTHQVMYM